MASFNRTVNQQLLDQVFGAGSIMAGEGRGEQALKYATPEQRAAYTQARQAYDNQGSYKPVYEQAYNGGVMPVGQIEPLNQMQRDAITRAAGGYQDTSFLDMVRNFLGGAENYVNAGSKSLSDADFNTGVDRYMNPYTQQVVDSTVGQIQKQADIDRSNINALFNDGSFGSSSHRIASQELADNTQRAIADATGGLYSSGFNNAIANTLNQYNADQGRKLQGASLMPAFINSGITAQDAGRRHYTQNLNDLFTAGNTVQRQNQNMLDIVRQEINAQRNYPVSQLQTIGSLLGPFNGGQSTGYGYDPNLISRLGGAGMVASRGIATDWKFGGG